jgi:hypothetical protein
MRFPGFDARSTRGSIRWELFIHHEVVEVLLTTRQDALCVVFVGGPRQALWTRTLTKAGYPAPEFGGPPADVISESPFDTAA